jgi:hypothetical protein
MRPEDSFKDSMKEAKGLASTFAPGSASALLTNAQLASGFTG